MFTPAAVCSIKAAMPISAILQQMDPQRKHRPPFFLLCQALLALEDGFAALRVIATCRQARDTAQMVANSLRNVRRALSRVLLFLQTEQPVLPGFEPVDRLQVAMLRLTIWDPPAHRTILTRRMAFMEHDFGFGAQGNLRQWISHHHPEFQGLDPVQILRAMNPSRQACKSFQAFVEMLAANEARFFFSPIVYSRRQPMDAQLPPGPALAIAFRYESYPVVLCFRYTEAHYSQTVVLPWLEAHGALAFAP